MGSTRCLVDVLARPRVLNKGLIFSAYYYVKDAPEDKKKSVREIADDLRKQGVILDYSGVARYIREQAAEFKNNPDLYKKYQSYVQGLLGPKYFYRLIKKPDGSEDIESTYPSVIDFYKRAKAHNLSRTYIHNVLNTCQKFWESIGRRNPLDWTEQDLNEYLTKTNKGSKFTVATHLARVAPKIKDIEGRTKNLKTGARIPPVLRLKNFPDVWRRIKKRAIDLALPSERDEIDLILSTKIATGIRTGDRTAERELWGTKIGEGKSYIVTEGDEVAWHTYAKWHEDWDINYWVTGLKEKLRTYIKQRGKKIGDYLIDMGKPRALELLREACKAEGVSILTLHDLRKAYVSNLVRSGVRLEKAIKLNVGWKDIATAYKHYLIFEDISQDIEDALKRFDQNAT